MISKSLKSIYLISSFIFIIVANIACKKNKLDVDTEKSFYQVDHISQGPYDNGWQLTLNPNQTADILPGGDIIYRGTYTINGSKLKVKADQISEQFEFKIISKTEIKEKKYGVRLMLTSNINQQ